MSSLSTSISSNLKESTMIIGDTGQILLLKLLIDKIMPSKISDISIVRNDVTVKKILRTGRRYYEMRLDQIT